MCGGYEGGCGEGGGSGREVTDRVRITTREKGRIRQKMENQYVLAMYDIRGKQDYIYKSNKMKEIIGAS